MLHKDIFYSKDFALKMYVENINYIIQQLQVLILLFVIVWKAIIQQVLLVVDAVILVRHAQILILVLLALLAGPSPQVHAQEILLQL